MNPNKALWEKGDFTRIADTMRKSADEVVEKIGVSKGMKVLDLGCGDGNTAIPAAKRGADVTGVDIASNLIEAATRRAHEAGLSNIRFLEGDASDLNDHGDDTFDLTLSMFGAMFAPRPMDVAKEMVRVTMPGGRVVMGNWIPNDPTLIAQLLKISGAYSPPPPEGFISPITWGVKENVVERFTNAGVPAENISIEADTFTFDHAGSPADFVSLFRDYYGPTMNAFAAATENGKDAELEAELVDLFSKQNRSDDPERTVIPANYLRVSVQV